MKRILRTGEVASICEVAPRTVHGWVDNGHLPGFRLPGGDRRVNREDLVNFMERIKMPPSMIAKAKLPFFRVLLVGTDLADPDLVRVLGTHGTYAVHAFTSCQAGKECAAVQPFLAVIDRSIGRTEANELRIDLLSSGVKVVALYGQLEGWTGDVIERPSDISNAKHIAVMINEFYKREIA